MFNAISGSTQYAPEQDGPASRLSLCYVDIPNQMVRSAVDATISRMAPAYLQLMCKAQEKPEIISDYKSSLQDYYKDLVMNSEIRTNVMEAQKMAPDCNVITEEYKSSLQDYYKDLVLNSEIRTKVMEAQKMALDCNVITKELPFGTGFSSNSERRISVFSEKNREFDKNQALDKARLFIKLKVNAKDIKEEDSLDHLLSQLSKKILSQGYGDEGTFDIRLEKGCLSLEGDPWRWHFDGEAFKTSISVCYSNKENWSTRVSDSKMESIGRPADHGFLYDALNVYHRAPIPSDLGGEELNADDYRLFIRYNEFYKKGERVISVIRVPAKKEERSVMSFSEKNPWRSDRTWERLLSEKATAHKIEVNTNLPGTDGPENIFEGTQKTFTPQLYEQLQQLFKEESSTIPPPNFLLTPLPLDLIHLMVTQNNFQYNFPGLFAELGTYDEIDSNEPTSPSQAQFDRDIDTPMNTRDNVLPVASEMEHAQHQAKNTSCTVM